jgi:hypothetical protein
MAPRMFRTKNRFRPGFGIESLERRCMLSASTGSAPIAESVAIVTQSPKDHAEDKIEPAVDMTNLSFVVQQMPVATFAALDRGNDADPTNDDIIIEAQVLPILADVMDPVAIDSPTDGALADVEPTRLISTDDSATIDDGAGTEKTVSDEDASAAAPLKPLIAIAPDDSLTAEEDASSGSDTSKDLSTAASDDASAETLVALDDAGLVATVDDGQAGEPKSDGATADDTGSVDDVPVIPIRFSLNDKATTDVAVDSLNDAPLHPQVEGFDGETVDAPADAPATDLETPVVYTFGGSSSNSESSSESGGGVGQSSSGSSSSFDLNDKFLVSLDVNGESYDDTLAELLASADVDTVALPASSTTVEVNQSNALANGFADYKAFDSALAQLDAWSARVKLG